MYTGAPTNSGIPELLGLLVTGSVIYIFIVLAIAFIGAYISYRIIKAAVRNGVIEALAKTGGSSGSGIIQGYPPAQSYGAPAAPVAEPSNYGGPMGR